jgi:hypothetical protein
MHQETTVIFSPFISARLLRRLGWVASSAGSLLRWPRDACSMRLDAIRGKSYTSFMAVMFAMTIETFARTCRRQKRLQGQGVDASFLRANAQRVARLLSSPVARQSGDANNAYCGGAWTVN